MIEILFEIHLFEKKGYFIFFWLVYLPVGDNYLLRE